MAFDALCASSWVRREWCTEPRSWLHMLQTAPHLVHVIVLEVSPRPPCLFPRR